MNRLFAWLAAGGMAWGLAVGGLAGRGQGIRPAILRSLAPARLLRAGPGLPGRGPRERQRRDRLPRSARLRGGPDVDRPGARRRTRRPRAKSSSTAPTSAWPASSPSIPATSWRRRPRRNWRACWSSAAASRPNRPAPSIPAPGSNRSSRSARCTGKRRPPSSPRKNSSRTCWPSSPASSIPTTPSRRRGSNSASKCGGTCCRRGWPWRGSARRSPRPIPPARRKTRPPSARRPMSTPTCTTSTATTWAGCTPGWDRPAVARNWASPTAHW